MAAGDQSMRDYGLAAPHGPNFSGRHVATKQVEMSDGEPESIRKILLPDDSYDANGTYWADLPLMQRIKFTSKTDAQEAGKELRSLGRMIREDPLSPVGFYMRNMVIPGAGLLLEGYVLFSIGNLTNLFAEAFPHCWGKKPTVCNVTWTQSVTYLEVSGIIIGQILVGILGDWLGRRWGLIQDAIIMFLGLLMLVAAWGTSLNGWVICYAWSLFFYSIGVGGEYPMTATSGMENAVGSGKISTREDRLHRGRKVVSAFLMQGWGQFLNQGILCILLLIFHGRGSGPYGVVLAQWTYRISFVIPAIGTLWLVYYRTYKMRSASKQLMLAKKKQRVTGYDVQSLKLTFGNFGGRLFATAAGWFANDVFFYGNKLFQSQFIQAIDGKNASVMTNWLWNLLNCGIELIGYYLASLLIDNKLYGRKWMQQVGFLADFICFLVPAFKYDYYASGPGVHRFQALYFISSFFGQFGPNCTTFLVAAEVFPTPIRASAHGFSAACGKLGALLAAILYNYISTPMRFLVVPWFGLAGMAITAVFLPDTTGLDLKEQERRWAYIRAGRGDEYHGVAVHPRHLSLWERMFGIGKQYNAEEDYRQRAEEMRADWEAAMLRRGDNEKGVDDDVDDDDWSDEVSTFFERMHTQKGAAGTNGDLHGNGELQGNGGVDEKTAH